jgi:high affinity Mn2+ porin
LYVEHRFAIGKEKENVDEEANVIAENANKNYVSVIAGKFALLDFFDGCETSHDPRTQFLNWALMGSGAWDYPANVRGYTFGVVAQLHLNNWGVKIASTSVPTEANGSDMEWKSSDASGNVFEVEKKKLFAFSKRKKHFADLIGGIYWNRARMGNYEQSIATALPTFSAPDVTDSRSLGRSKFGYYITMDNHFGKVNQFIKYSWSDGKNETWAFTEIDRSIATGLAFDGSLWKRKEDKIGIAYVNNGLSDSHKKYLSLGGNGFIIGDGKLNYGTEQIVELYYSCNVWKKIFVTPDYQFISHPAYNKDRGPVSVFSLRLHVEL